MNQADIYGQYKLDLDNYIADPYLI